jgi:hypothetical protein
LFGEVVAITTDTEADCPADNETLAGLAVQEVSAGAPEQLMVTAPLKVELPAREASTVPVAPWASVSVAGVAVSRNAGAREATVTVIGEALAWLWRASPA